MHMVGRRRSPAQGDGGLCPFGCTAAPDLLPQPCRLAAALSLVGRGDTRGRMPRGWDLELTSGWLWSPHKRPFQAKLWKKKVMIFTALGGAQV